MRSRLRQEADVGATSGSGSGSAGLVSDDIEELGVEWLSPLDRFRTHRTLSVTDLSSQAWCEQQLALGLQHGRRRTPAMQKGIERHEALELELHDIINIDPSLEVETQQDRWAIRLLNCMFGARELRLKGRTREFCVFGSVDALSSSSSSAGIWAQAPVYSIGIVDHITLRDGHCHISDTKTRTTPTMPSIAQKRTSSIQLLLYKFLFDIMHSFPDSADIDESSSWWRFLVDQELDPTTKTFSSGVRDQLQQWGLSGLSLVQILERTLTTVASLPPSSNSLTVEYEFQEDHSTIGEDSFLFNSNWIFNDVSFFLEFWQGLRSPQSVVSCESWKCRYCQFQSICTSSPAAALPIVDNMADSDEATQAQDE